MLRPFHQFSETLFALVVVRRCTADAGSVIATGAPVATCSFEGILKSR